MSAVFKFLALVVVIAIGFALWEGLSEAPAAQPFPADQPASAHKPDALPPPAKDELRLVFTYGSEKESWVKAATAEFNAAANRLDGQRITVEAIPMGSGECVEEAISGTRQVHLISPASKAFITIGNAQSRTKTGNDLVAETRDLVLSPVVIALWKPMAEALGWPGKPVGWAEVLALAQHPQGWASVGQAQWGAFRFGHTHPEYSNSGIISVRAECYAGAGKTAGLSLEDLAKPELATFVNGIERSVVHYGRSTGFFATRLAAGGPAKLSAAVLYESSVIEANQKSDGNFPPLVSIYPREGTFWSDHPAGIVERPWVTPAHRAAAKKYLDFLLGEPRQRAALALGFRPAAVEIAIAAPIDAAHGADPKQPTTTLEVPPAPVIDAALRLWRDHKKRSSVVLVLDTSGSMKDEGRMAGAKLGAAALINQLGDEDRLSLLTFNDRMTWVIRDQPVAGARTQLLGAVQGLYPDGGTALYDAVAAAYQAASAIERGRIAAVVVLTDGADTDSQIKLGTLEQTLAGDSERSATVRVFTIAYGKGANKDILKRIAERTQAKSYSGGSGEVEALFKDIATFF